MYTHQVNSDVDLKDAFKSLSYDDRFDDAQLGSAVHYVRGSKLLRIPDEWRALLPGSF